MDTLARIHQTQHLCDHNSAIDGATSRLSLTEQNCQAVCFSLRMITTKDHKAGQVISSITSGWDINLRGKTQHIHSTTRLDWQNCGTTGQAQITLRSMTLDNYKSNAEQISLLMRGLEVHDATWRKQSSQARLSDTKEELQNHAVEAVAMGNRILKFTWAVRLSVLGSEEQCGALPLHRDL